MRSMGHAALSRLGVAVTAMMGLSFVGGVAPAAAQVCSFGAAGCANNTAVVTRRCSRMLTYTGLATTTPVCGVGMGLTASVGAIIPATGLGVVTLECVRLDNSTNGSCSWPCDALCGGGTVLVTMVDGLPVELMDFEVDVEDEAQHDADGPDEDG